MQCQLSPSTLRLSTRRTRCPANNLPWLIIYILYFLRKMKMRRNVNYITTTTDILEETGGWDRPTSVPVIFVIIISHNL